MWSFCILIKACLCKYPYSHRPSLKGTWHCLCLWGWQHCAGDETIIWFSQYSLFCHSNSVPCSLVTSKNQVKKQKKKKQTWVLSESGMMYLCGTEWVSGLFLTPSFLAALWGWCQTSVDGDVQTVAQDRTPRVCEKPHHPQHSWPYQPNAQSSITEADWWKWPVLGRGHVCLASVCDPSTREVKENWSRTPLKSVVERVQLRSWLCLQLKATSSNLGFLSNKRVIFVAGLDNMPEVCLISQLVWNSRWQEMGAPYWPLRHTHLLRWFLLCLRNS